MKIYKLTYFSEPDEGTCVAWYGSKQQAIKALSAVKCVARDNGGEIYREELQALSVTPTRRGILRFLTIHTPSHDNG